MKAIYLKGKFYLAHDTGSHGTYGAEITQEAYDALKLCRIGDDDEINLDDKLKGSEHVHKEYGYLLD